MKLHEFNWPSNLRLEIEPDEYPGETFVFVSESYKPLPTDSDKIVFRSREIALMLFFDTCKGGIKSFLYRLKKEFGQATVKRFFLDPSSIPGKWREWTRDEIGMKWGLWTEKQKEVYEKTRKLVLWLIGPVGNSPLHIGHSSVETKKYAWSIAASEADSYSESKE